MPRLRAIAALGSVVLTALVLFAGPASAAGTGAVAGYIWYDANYDGLRNEGSAAGLANVTVRLTDLGPDGSPGTGDDIVYPPFVTGANGFYAFRGLPAGRHRIQVDLSTAPPGLSLTTGLQPYLDVTLSAGQVLQEVNFGFALLSTGGGTIGDRVWYDINGNATLDIGEPGIDGATVKLGADLDGDGVAEFTRTAMTRSLAGERGIYAFDLLPVGTYTVAVDPLTLPRNLLPSFDFDGILTPHRAAVPLQGQVNVGVDFGYKRCGVETGNLTLKSKKIKWKIANAGDATLTLDRIFVSWPAEAGSISRIKLGGRTISTQLLTGPQALVYNWTGYLADRQIKIDKQKELQIEFANDIGRSTTGFVVRVEFAEGCVIEYVGDRSGINFCDAGRKPKQLTVLYTGESCIASDNIQATDKTSCVDFAALPAAAQSVYIRTSDRADPLRQRRQGLVRGRYRPGHGVRARCGARL